MPALSAEQYRRLRPYLELGERLGAFIAQAAPSPSFSRIRIRYAGEPAELGSHVVRSAVLTGVLNCVLIGKSKSGERLRPRPPNEDSIVEETTRRRERGFPNTGSFGDRNTAETAAAEQGREIADSPSKAPSFPTVRRAFFPSTASGSKLRSKALCLLTRNRDVPGVIGQIGTALGNLGVNIATFALGRRSPCTAPKR